MSRRPDQLPTRPRDARTTTRPPVAAEQEYHESLEQEDLAEQFLVDDMLADEIETEEDQGNGQPSMA